MSETMLVKEKRLARAAMAVVLALVIAGCGGGATTPVSLGAQIPAAGIESNPVKARAIASKAAKAVTDARQQAAAEKAAQREAAKGVPAPLPPAAGKAKQNDPTQPGTYTYHITGDANDGKTTTKINEDAKVKYDRPFLAQAGGQRQKVRDAGSGSCGGGECQFLWEADKVSLQSVVVSGFNCTFSPALKIRPVPLVVGAKWSSQGVCEGVTTKIDGEVLRQEKMTIGGKQIVTFVMHIVTNTQGGTGPQAFAQKSDATEWFSPAYRITVKQVAKGEFSGFGSTGKSNTTSILKKLTPS